MEVKQGDVIAVWFSCGAASAVAAKKTIQKYGHIATIRILNNFVVEEHPDNRRFLKDVEKWLGYPIEEVVNPSHKHCSAEQIWEDRSYMAGVSGAPCTMLLKQEARRKWEMLNQHDYHVLGFTADEKGRYVKFTKQRPNTLPVLIELGITKADCFRIIQEAGIELPEIYKLGYPNANCIGCVKASGVTYWNHVRKIHPDIFEKRETLSREIGAKLVKVHPKYLPFCRKIDGEWYDSRTSECLHFTDKKTGKRKLKTPRVFLDELPTTAKGNPMKDMNFECGIFCGNK